MHPNFEKILRFAQTTGDKLVVTNLEGDEPIVVMSLAAYAELVGFSSLKQSVEGERKNRRKPSPNLHNDIDTLSQVADEHFAVEEPRPAPLRTDRKSLPKQSEKPQEKPSEKPIFQVPEDTPLQAEMHISQESAKKQEPEDEVQEEQFYLEPVE